MLNSLTSYLIIIIFSITVIFIQELRIKNANEDKAEALETVAELKTKIITQNSAIDKLSQQSALKDAQIKIAENSAKKQRAEYNKKANEILNENVPKNCDQAIMWAIKQANKFPYLK